MTIQPRPWHDEAKRLSAEGLPVAGIARQLGVSWELVRRLLDPEYRARTAARDAERQRQAYRNDPKFRARKREWNTRVNTSTGMSKCKIRHLRIQAKCTAYDTGRTYEDVCKSWGVEP